MTPPRIKVDIGELSLPGLDHLDPRRVGRDLERELTRLVGEQGIPAGVASRRVAPSLEAGAIPVSSAASPDRLGVAVARQIYSRLKR